MTSTTSPLVGTARATRTIAQPPTSRPTTRNLFPTSTSRRLAQFTAGSRLATAVLALGVATLWTYLGLQRHQRLQTGMDLTIFDQAVRNLAHFRAPYSAMKGMNLWGDHWHPAIVVFVPFYWLWDDPRSLIIAQAVFVAMGCAIVVRASVEHLGNYLPRHWVTPTSLLLGASFALAPGVQQALLFDVHEVAIGVPILALAMANLLRSRWRQVALWSLLLLTVKEDTGLFVLGIAVVVAMKGQRRLALALAGASIGYTALAIKVIIPAFSPVHAWAYSGALGSPRQLLQQARLSLLDPAMLSITMAILVLATLGLALRSPLTLAIVPNVASRAVSFRQSYWLAHCHYNLLPSVVLAFAALDGLVRLRQASQKDTSQDRRDAIWLVTALLCMFGLLLGYLSHGINPSPTPVQLDAAHTAIAQVPDGASVASGPYLTPQLSKLHPSSELVDPPNYGPGVGTAVAAEWIVLDPQTEVAYDYFTGSGYRQVWPSAGSVQGYVVLRR